MSGRARGSGRTDPLAEARDLMVDLDDLVAGRGRGPRGGRPSRSRRRRSRRSLAGVVVAVVVLAAVLLGQQLLDGAGGPSGSAGVPVAVPTSVPDAAERAVVERVVDGDTVVVEVGGARERLRLIGVDTPETVRPGAPVDCYGPEASAWTTGALPAGAIVWLEADPTQGDRDRYDRLLRFVWTDSGELVNRELVARGLGREDTYDEPYRYRDEFLAAQRTAEAQRTGLWGAC